MMQRWLGNSLSPGSAGGGEEADSLLFWQLEGFERARDLLEEFGAGVLIGWLLFLAVHDELYFLI